MARHATVPAITQSVIPLTRTTEDVAEEIYMESEKSLAVMRAELDQLTKEVSKNSVEILRVHNANGERCKAIEDQAHRQELILVELVGTDGKGGLVYSLKRQCSKLFQKVDDLKSKYWRILIALAGTGAGGIGVGKYFL